MSKKLGSQEEQTIRISRILVAAISLLKKADKIQNLTDWRNIRLQQCFT
jgi:hypothetical protein